MCISYVTEHRVISRLEAAAAWRKCIPEVPFIGFSWVSVIHPEHGWKIETGNGMRERRGGIQRKPAFLLYHKNAHSLCSLSQNIMYDKRTSVSHIYLIFKWVHTHTEQA